LPVLAEAKRAPIGASVPRHRPVRSHFAATLAGGCALLVFVVLLAVAADLLSGPAKLTFSTAVPHAATPRPTNSALAGPASPKARRSEPQAKRPARRPKARVSARREAAPKKVTSARMLPAVQRVFSWRRRAAAAYYQFDFQRGGKTIYEARTKKLRAALPARLKLRPGTYTVLVHPAVTTDAGIVLGPPIVVKTIRV
jgi:hypothetical protein